MACSRYIPYGSDHIIITCRSERVPICSVPGCLREAVVLCDGPGPTKRRTCDKPLCLVHAAEIATDHHLCREHAAGMLGATLGPVPILSESAIDDLTRCRDVRCAHRHRCLRWTDCRDQAVRVFDFGSTKAAPEWQCRWFEAVFTPTPSTGTKDCEHGRTP